MSALLGFVPPPSITPASTPLPATGSLQMTPEPSTAAKPITGGNYPRLKPRAVVPPSKEPPAAAGGFSLGSFAGALAGALALTLLVDEPLSKDQANVSKLQPPEPSQEIEQPTFLFKGGQSRAYYRIDYTGITQIDGSYTKSW